MNYSVFDEDEREISVLPELIPQVSEILDKHNIKVSDMNNEGFKLSFIPPYHSCQYVMPFKFSECRTVENFSNKLKELINNFDEDKFTLDMINRRDSKGMINGEAYPVKRIVDYADIIHREIANLRYDIGYNSAYINSCETELAIPPFLNVTMEQRGFKIIPDSIKRNSEGSVEIQLTDDTVHETYGGNIRTFSDDIYYIAQLGRNPDLIAEFDNAEATPKTFKELLETKGYEDAELEISVRIQDKNEVQMFCELHSDGLHEDAFVGMNIPLTKKEQEAIYNNAEKQLGKNSLKNLIEKSIKKHE